MKRNSSQGRILTAILCLSLIFFGLCACGQTGPTPTETADTFLKGIQEGDTDAVNSVYAPGNFQISDLLIMDNEESEDLNEDETMAKALFTKIREFDYELSNEQIDGDSATVDVTITSYPFGEATTEFLTEYMTQAFALAFSDASDDQLNKLAEGIFLKKIGGLKEKNCRLTAKLPMTRIDGIWKIGGIGENSEFLNAITGNMVTAMEDMEEIYSNFEEESEAGDGQQGQENGAQQDSGQQDQ